MQVGLALKVCSVCQNAVVHAYDGPDRSGVTGKQKNIFCHAKAWSAVIVTWIATQLRPNHLAKGR
jgi:hypothetical protein